GQPGWVLAGLLGGLRRRPAPGGPVGPIPLIEAPRDRPGPHLVRPIWAGGRVLRPAPPGGSNVHQPPRGRGPDEPLEVQPVHGARVPAVDVRAGVPRIQAGGTVGRGRAVPATRVLAGRRDRGGRRRVVGLAPGPLPADAPASAGGGPRGASRGAAAGLPMSLQGASPISGATD